MKIAIYTAQALLAIDKILVPIIISQMANISVCTIYANRQSHLMNLIAGLRASTTSFNELVIVTMNDELPQLPAVPFSIKTAAINTNNNFLPLAAARNKSAELATGEKLVFLDIDCIANQDAIALFNYHLDREDALYQGSIRYLESGWQQKQWTYNSLQQQSALHKLQGKQVINRNKISHPYQLFWSLCFGIRKKTFDNLGGFDESYSGYGGEDTDFSFTARQHNLLLYKVSALAYHQFHPSYSPPLNHLEEIVNNAEVFYKKWNVLPMSKWLEQFADKGYIQLQDNRLKIIKYPSRTEIEACLKQQ
ncbi:MAG: glycosyltransferase family 2 protein [Pleurocapsa sp.]